MNRTTSYRRHHHSLHKKRLHAWCDHYDCDVYHHSPEKAHMFPARWTRGTGRYWKPKLSRARRRYIKQTLRGHKTKEPITWEGNINYKLW